MVYSADVNYILLLTTFFATCPFLTKSLSSATKFDATKVDVLDVVGE